VPIHGPRKDGQAELSWVAWLNTETVYPWTFTHLSTNPVRRRATLLIEANALPSSQGAAAVWTNYDSISSHIRSQPKLPERGCGHAVAVSLVVIKGEVIDLSSTRLVVGARWLCANNLTDHPKSYLHHPLLPQSTVPGPLQPGTRQCAHCACLTSMSLTLASTSDRMSGRLAMSDNGRYNKALSRTTWLPRD